MPNTVSLQMQFQAEELPQGIEGINGLEEIWALQVYLNRPNVNTIDTELWIFCRQIETDTKQTSTPNQYLCCKYIRKGPSHIWDAIVHLSVSVFCDCCSLSERYYTLKSLRHSFSTGCRLLLLFPPTQFKTSLMSITTYFNLIHIVLGPHNDRRRI